jgi:threonine aldolase
MAQLLAQRLRDFPAVDIINPVQANSVFVRMPQACVAGLRAAGWNFYNFIGNSVRLMTSWDSTPADIDRFCADLSALNATPSN